MLELLPIIVLGVMTFILILFAVPVAFSLIASSVLVFLIWPDQPLWLIAQKMVNGMDSFTLLAIPFFILAAEIMNASGSSRRIVDVFNGIFGRMPGGLAQVNVGTNMFLAGISGSAIADATATGSMLIPEMKKSGYPASFSAALTAAAAICGPIIPPSIPLVIYGVIAKVSILKLFVAGYLPGLLIVLVLMFYVNYKAKKDDFPKEPKISLKELGTRARNGIWDLAIPVLIVVGILAGVFTVTELGAVLIVYALVIGIFVRRELSLGALPKMIKESALGSANIMIVVGASSIIAYILVIHDVPTLLPSFILNVTENPILILLLVNIVFLIAGMFLDSTPATVILVPIFLPLMENIGIDPVHFGIIVVFNLMLGLLTPPVALNLFATSAIAEVPFWESFKSVLPMLALLFALLLLITYIPIISLGIPNLFGM